MATWFFQERHSWHPFDAAAEAAVEDAYNNERQTCRSTFFNPRSKRQTDYVYDLTKMQQINQDKASPAISDENHPQEQVVVEEELLALPLLLHAAAAGPPAAAPPPHLAAFAGFPAAAAGFGGG
eukprot:CAMPEP_0177720950 /NCGR_PEP_ID=MMETSP0484_2-20121128/16886_1 /TAXON_ID=354590 /ORGANISM="Rhodomonas lens, Strain RHODO" /LENGTH=123 /DNA_ID=CAMNT_0019233221 /DNA_START=85 /DNA_END=453 /DNA_ORIENTATION=-